jgi:hypothetical protein
MNTWHDCPVCPGCGLNCTVPTRVDHHHSGPAESTLKCPACGLGWVGSADDVALAERAQAAWEERKAQGLA